MSASLPPDGSDRRIFRVPKVVLGLFLVMAAIQALESLAPPSTLDGLLTDFAFIPLRWTNLLDPGGVADAIGALREPLRSQALALLGDGSAHVWTPISYAFFHGGWEHFFMNGLWLLAFGAPVAQRVSGLRFLVLFCLSSVGGAAAQWMVQPYGADILVGASAGISGVVAAATRIVFQPGGELGASYSEPLAETPAAQTLLATLRNTRSMSFIVLWMIANVVFGYLAEPMGFSPGPVAWQAHVGGFVVGFVLLSFLLNRRRRSTS